MRGYLYILLSESGRYYIGSSKDPHTRYEQHVAGHTHSTKRMGSLKLVFTQAFPTIEEARTAERTLKHWKRKDYIEKIIRDGKMNIG